MAVQQGVHKIERYHGGEQPRMWYAGFQRYCWLGSRYVVSFLFYFILLLLFHIGSTDNTSITVTGLGTPDFHKLLVSALFHGGNFSSGC